MQKLYLIKLGEISLKKGNRNAFEKKLKENIKHKLKPYASRITTEKGREYLYVDSDCPDETVEKALSTTFGITGYARSYIAEKDLKRIKESASECLDNSAFENKGSFRVAAKRSDKSFPLKSSELEIELAKVVSKRYPDLTVDLDNADYTLSVEIRDKAYIYSNDKKGESGLPVGTAGSGIALLSGGIDSPVAAYMMAKRGMKLTLLHFHAYPFTSEEALEKTKRLAAIIAPYLQGAKLYSIPFLKGQEHIKEKGIENEATLLFRASMMETTERLLKMLNGEAIVTGEALSQVASQTLKSMVFTDSMCSSLILRPLLGMDKEEIIEKAKRIGTYEVSILPFEDCCSAFSPKHPNTHPDLEEMREHYKKLEMDKYIDEALENMSVFSFDDKGRLYAENN